MAATEEKEAAGNSEYQGSHMNALFQEGFSFSGFERDLLALNLGSGRYVDISGVSGVDSISPTLKSATVEEISKPELNRTEISRGQSRSIKPTA